MWVAAAGAWRVLPRISREIIGCSELPEGPRGCFAVEMLTIGNRSTRLEHKEEEKNNKRMKGEEREREEKGKSI